MRAMLGRNGLLNRFLLQPSIIDTPGTWFLYNQTAIRLTIVVILLPFAILPIFLSLERIPPDLLRASADRGGGQGTTFAKVIVLLTLTLPLRLWGMVRVGFTPEINALVTLVSGGVGGADGHRCASGSPVDPARG